MKEIKLQASPQIKVMMPDDSVVVLRKPNLGDAEAQVEAEKHGTSVSTQVKFLVALGMPEDKARSLDFDQLQVLIEALSPEKKS